MTRCINILHIGNGLLSNIGKLVELIWYGYNRGERCSFKIKSRNIGYDYISSLIEYV